MVISTPKLAMDAFVGVVTALQRRSVVIVVKYPFKGDETSVTCQDFDI